MSVVRVRALHLRVDYLMINVAFFFLFDLSHHLSFFFFFNDTATTEIYTLSLHDALPICSIVGCARARSTARRQPATTARRVGRSTSTPARASKVSARTVPRRATTHGSTSTIDRKSTRLNSSHDQISYAVFCLKKKKKKKI